MKTTDLIKAVESWKARSAWNKGVKEYAEWILNKCLDNDDKEIDKPISLYLPLANAHMKLWDVCKEMSYGGCFEIYDLEIAKNLCTASELKSCIRKDGSLRDKANARESWLDVQTRALYQAVLKIEELRN